ncbi:DUF998 domain-containing protein [Alkaliphilus sp. B6464]|uniref:DUF998 domain-containing protein n=1 Tax=Alkaliphilus sp. B6464 TaxID=2731219 RepID=UPI002010E02C|nr:DUF998 domain-containing protein [Alkaliphilus sp. B6464]
MINRAFIASMDCSKVYIFLLIATVGDLLLPFLLAPFYTGYNPSKMVMSLLGNKNYPLHIIYNIWLVLAGILFLLSAVNLYILFAPVSKTLTICLTVSLAVYAIGACILSGLFSVGITKELVTMPEKIHGYGSVIGFFVLLFAPLILSCMLFKMRDVTFAVIALLCFFLAVGSFALFIMADKTRFLGTFIENEGIWQRLCLLFVYLPFTVLSIRQLI